MRPMSTLLNAVVDRLLKRFSGHLVAVMHASFSNQIIEHVAHPIKVLPKKIRASKLRVIVLCVNTFLLPLARFAGCLLICKRTEIVPNLIG